MHRYLVALQCRDQRLLEAPFSAPDWPACHDQCLGGSLLLFRVTSMQLCGRDASISATARHTPRLDMESGWPKVRCDTRSAASERGVSSCCSMTVWGMFGKASTACGCCALNRNACQGWAGHHQPRRRVPGHRVVGLSEKASKAVGENTPRCLVNFKTYKNLNKTPLSQNSSIDKSRATQVTSEFRPIPCP